MHQHQCLCWLEQEQVKKRKAEQQAKAQEEQRRQLAAQQAGLHEVEDAGQHNPSAIGMHTQKIRACTAALSHVMMWTMRKAVRYLVLIEGIDPG